jgi:hypothetical protein
MMTQATLGDRQVVTRAKGPAAAARDPILASKITAPGVPDWAVQRPRISKLIAEGVRWCPLTVVTGPPGRDPPGRGGPPGSPPRADLMEGSP